MKRNLVDLIPYRAAIARRYDSVALLQRKSVFTCTYMSILTLQ
jgi:hypothetical protein